MFCFVLFLLLTSIPAANPDQSELSLTLQEGDSAYARGDYERARAQFAQALKIYEREKNSQGIADTSFKLGAAYRRLGKYSDALQAFDKALKLHEVIRDRQAVGMDLTEMATLHRAQGDYPAALDLCQKALVIHEEIGNQKGIAKTLDTIGKVHHFKAEYSDAIKYFERALKISEEIGDKEDEAAVLSDFGSVYWIQGDFSRALEYYARGLKIADEIDNVSLQGSFHGNIGLIYWNQGDFNKALEEFFRCDEIFKKIGSLSHLATNYFNIGLLQSNLGNYGEAQEFLQKSLQMSEEMNDKGLKGVVLEGLGTLHRDLGNHDTALKYLEESYRVTKETGEKRATTYALMGIASIHEERGNYSLALEDYRKAYRLYTEMGEKKGIAQSLNKIGAVYVELKNYDRALINFQAALSIQEAIGNKPGIGHSNMMIGSAYYRKGKMDEADAALTKAIEVLREVGQPDLLWPALYREALTYRDQGKVNDSLQYMEEAVALIEKVRGEVGLAEQKSGFLENKLDPYEDLIRLLVKNQNPSGAFEYVEKSKARAFLDLLSETRIDPQGTLNPEQYEKKKTLQIELASLNKKIRDEYDKDQLNMTTVRDLEKKRDGIDQEYEDLLLEIRKQNPRYADLQYPQPLKLSEAQKLLDSDTVLMDYFTGKSASLLFVITAGSSQVVNLPGEQMLKVRVQELLESIQKPEAVWEASSAAYSKYLKMANALYKELLGPAEPVFKDKHRIIIAPDGVLNYLPFECLLTKEKTSTQVDFSKLPYLAVNYDVQYIPSISVLGAVERIAGNGSSSKKLLAFADPLVESSSKTKPRTVTASDQTFREWSASLPGLPYSRTEVENISSLYPKDEVTVLYGKEASEKNAKEMKLDQYQILHFASHGLIDEERPQFSALILSAGNTGEDGFLTMREVFELKLNADLVVLSACKTGLGKKIRGEGVTGLSRAFFCAGTSSVLVSLWNVYDRSTADFMASFYRSLQKEGMNKASALKEARLEMIQSKKYSHPYYWAPFILIGNR